MKLLTLSIVVAVCLLIACNQKSPIEKIIIDDEFVKKQLVGYTKESLGKDGEYYSKDSFIIRVLRNDSNRIFLWEKTVNNQVIDRAEIYSSTGQVMGKLSFVNGIIEGPVKYYYEDGRIKAEGVFKNNYWWGEWKEYDENGELISITKYFDEKHSVTQEIKSR